MGRLDTYGTVNLFAYRGRDDATAVVLALLPDTPSEHWVSVGPGG